MRARTVIALALSVLTVLAAAQSSGLIPRSVAADEELKIQLLRAPTSTESLTATGTARINLQTGQVRFELNGATPNSVYIVTFVSGSSSLQVGLLATGAEGQGSLMATMNAGAYVGIFTLTRGGLVQFVSASASFTIGLTATISAGLSTTTIIGGTLQVDLRIEPAVVSIRAGAVARFEIKIKTASSASISLAAKGVPPGSIAIFTHAAGVANPEFESQMAVVTSSATPVDNYVIVVLVAVNNQQELDLQAALQVTSGSSSTTTTTISAGASLSITLTTDRQTYDAGATVNLSGQVADASGSAVADANVSIQVDGPTGGEIVFISNLKTNVAGVFRTSFKLAATAKAGTYTVFASAAKAGFVGATIHTTFVVGVSLTPSVVIKEIFVTDVAGTRTAVFSVGQTVLVWVVVENSGAPFQGVIWVQIRDPNGVPVFIQLQISMLANASVKVAFGFTLLAGASVGLYHATALVSDKLISQGGAFFASANAKFVLTG